jgi:hypothetical protein
VSIFLSPKILLEFLEDIRKIEFLIISAISSVLEGIAERL